MASDRMDFLRKHLTKNPNASYQDVQAAAAKKGHEVPPVVYGRAKALLGLVKTKKKASKKKASRKKATRKTKATRGRPARVGVGRRRGPGRPRKTVSPTDTLDGLVEAMRNLERERDQYRDALNQISEILNGL